MNHSTNIYQTTSSPHHNHDIHQYRLKTPRRRTRLARQDAERFLRALYRERDKLYARRRALGWVPLDPPIVRGWKRHFVLREDVARSAQAAFYEALLQKLNTVQKSHRKDFRVKARRFGKKVYVERGQNLNQPSEWEWQKWALGERAKRLFEERLVPTGQKGHVRKAYVFLEPWRYVLRVVPNVITQMRERDEVLEARIEAIDTYLQRRGLREKAARIIYGSARTRWYGNGRGERPRERWEYRHVPLHRLLADDTPDEMF